MSDSALTAVPAIDNTFGAVAIGTLVAGILWGISCMQAYEFFSRFPDERIGIKVLVGITWTLDTVHQVLISHMTYWYLVSSFGAPQNLALLTWSVKDMVLISALTALAVQLFFVYRVWTLSKGNWFISGAIAVSVFGSFAVTAAFYAEARKLTLWSEIPGLKGLSLSSNALSAASDVLISIAMIWLLAGLKTGYSRSTAAINRIIAFIVTTGTVTTICAIMSLILITVYPDTLIYITFYVLLGRLYTNSFLATLNARRRGSGTDTSNVSFNTTTHHSETTGGRSKTTGGLQQNMNANHGTMSIQVTSERVTDSTSFQDQDSRDDREYKSPRDDLEGGYELAVYPHTK